MMFMFFVMLMAFVLASRHSAFVFFTPFPENVSLPVAPDPVGAFVIPTVIINHVNVRRWSDDIDVGRFHRSLAADQTGGSQNER